MGTVLRSFTHLSDQELLGQVRKFAQRERHATVQLIGSLMELDTRRLYLGEGCSSLFTYCTRVLRLSEHAAYGRIEAARAARRFPVILDLLADGAITLTTVGVLASHLTPDNHVAVLKSARHKSKRDVERLVAELSPRPAVATAIRKLPTCTPLAAGAGVDAPQAPAATMAPPPVRQSATHAARAAVVTPLAPERYKVQLTITRETHDKLRRAQDLLRHSVPDGDAARIFDRALTVLLEQLTKRKLAATEKPRAARPTARGSRHIPAAVRCAVWARDAGRCAFMGATGRCSETGFLEFHHITPFAAGGQAVEDNLELRCRAHNAYEAAQYFGSGQPWLLRETRVPYTPEFVSSVRTELLLRRSRLSGRTLDIANRRFVRERGSEFARGNFGCSPTSETCRISRCSRCFSLNASHERGSSNAPRCLTAACSRRRRGRGHDRQEDLARAFAAEG